MAPKHLEWTNQFAKNDQSNFDIQSVIETSHGILRWAKNQALLQRSFHSMERPESPKIPKDNPIESNGS